jgi:dephospho-CoA kinase
VIVLGLTGSIAMGKTETAKIFAELGCPVFDADKAVRELYGPGGAAVPLVAQLFPNAVRQGIVDRKILSAEALADKRQLQELEEAVHPLVRAAEKSFLARHLAARLVVLDIPLLFETGRDKDVDYTAVVTVDAAEQRRRALDRPGMTAEKLAAILDRQMPDVEKRARAGFIIETTTPEAARAQAAEIVARLTKEAK